MDFGRFDGVLGVLLGLLAVALAIVEIRFKFYQSEKARLESLKLSSEPNVSRPHAPKGSPKPKENDYLSFSTAIVVVQFLIFASAILFNAWVFRTEMIAAAPLSRMSIANMIMSALTISTVFLTIIVDLLLRFMRSSIIRKLD